MRYSRPGLQSHINYLYGMTIGADQRVSRDAAERYAELRTAHSTRIARAHRGPPAPPAADAAHDHPPSVMSKPHGLLGQHARGVAEQALHLRRCDS